MKILFIKLLFLFLLFSCLSAQEIDINPYLKKIETGDVEDSRSALELLINRHPDDPSIQYLDAVLTDDGESALNKYKKIFENHPQSRYADASLFKVFSYYYATGYYKQAQTFLDKLNSDYPASPYIKLADRDIPSGDENEYIFPASEDSVSNQIKPDEDVLEVYKYTVQAGAFLDIKNAQRLAERLKKEGYYTEINAKEVGGTLLNVVTMGKYKDLDAAQSALNFLKLDFKLNGRIIEL